jgi:hypothetical protein
MIRKSDALRQLNEKAIANKMKIAVILILDFITSPRKTYLTYYIELYHNVTKIFTPNCANLQPILAKIFIPNVI